jgi:hypothetical protein
MNAFIMNIKCLQFIKYLQGIRGMVEGIFIENWIKPSN